MTDQPPGSETEVSGSETSGVTGQDAETTQSDQATQSEKESAAPEPGEEGSSDATSPDANPAPDSGQGDSTAPDSGQGDSTPADGPGNDTGTGATDSGGDNGTGNTGAGDTGSDTGDAAESDAGTGDTGPAETGDTASSDGGSGDIGRSGDAADSSGPAGTSESGTMPADTATASSAQRAADAPADLGPPYLFADLYAGDSGPSPQWSILVNRPDFYGVILKAMQVPYSDGGWFAHNWPRVRDAGGDRYGTSWFRGAYLFLDFARDGAAQADAYLKAVEDAGGWDAGDTVPIVDAELGDNPSHANYIKTTPRQKVVDVVSAAASRLKQVTGRKVMLYGRSALAENNIRDTLGCDLAWNPSYTAHPHLAGFEGFSAEQIVLWQYAGDNKGVLAGYPTSVQGFAKLDISVFIKGAQSPTLEDVRASLL